MRRWLVPGILALGALAAAWGALTYQPAPVGPAGPPAPTSTPVVSARRLPVALTALVADEHLAGRLNAVLDDPALGATRAAS
ncbi:MAG TPA: hypothetical protein VNY84_07125, partial [Acidimicrobiales bacterium]|nr:hypothetical protein [Acidimicrobiales bacterium]